MTKEEKLIREYFEPIEDINGNETIEVLPLTLVDMLLEYKSKILKLHKHFVSVPKGTVCQYCKKPSERIYDDEIRAWICKHCKAYWQNDR